MGNRKPVAELIASLEQATLMSHQIGTAVERNQLLQISSSLRTAHHRLSTLLLSTVPSPASDNSVSSVDPMQLGEGEAEAMEDERDSAVEKVEEKMRECFIRNKRAKKRPLSPSSAVVETSATEERSSRDYYYGQFDLDPNASKKTLINLGKQFYIAETVSFFKNSIGSVFSTLFLFPLNAEIHLVL
ncbi:unnamed protein product [Brassica oleracea var. botrytis]|uniref:(rape) hypothetical protein n=1 Tax=Brassica napus TaxID=3708 RepID=A0A816KN40_BRANA|nr:unnamed protein product [Brassica napus]